MREPCVNILCTQSSIFQAQGGEEENKKDRLESIGLPPALSLAGPNHSKIGSCFRSNVRVHKTNTKASCNVTSIVFGRALTHR